MRLNWNYVRISIKHPNITVVNFVIIICHFGESLTIDLASPLNNYIF